ncbi:unnamed protein product [Diamesa serratosioi]
MYGKSSKSKKPDDSINTLNCSSMNTWNTGNSLKKPANGWENGFNSFGNVPTDPRMSVSAIPNTADAEQTMQYYHYMQYMQVMQMKAAAAYSTNPLGIGLNPLENLPNATAPPSYSLAAQMSGLPPGRPRPQVDDPRIYSVGRSDGGGRRDNESGGSGSQRSSLTKSKLTYGEYKRQQEMLNNPNMNGNSQNNDGWDDPPRSSRPKQSNAPPTDDWDDEPTPSAVNKPTRKTYAPQVDDWDDEPTKIPMKKPQSDPWDEPSSSSMTKRSNISSKDEWDDERPSKKKPITDDWDDEPAPQSSRGFSNARSIEPNDDWEDAQPAPNENRGRDSYKSNDRGGYRGRGGNRGGGSKTIEKRDGDWDCKDCGNNNFKWRKECQRCGTAGGNPDSHSRSSRGGFNRGRDRYNRGSSRDSSQSSDHHTLAKDDWDDEGSVKSNGSNDRRGNFNSNKRRHDDSNRGPSKRYDTQSIGDDWDEEPVKAKATKMPPVPVDDWNDEPVSAPKKRFSSKNNDWDDDKGPRSPSPERERRRRRASPDDKLRRLEIELKLQRLENERLKLAFSGRRIGMTPSPPRSPSPEYEPVSRRRRHSPKSEKNRWESRRYRDVSVERSSSSNRRRPLEDDTRSLGDSSSKSSSHKSRFSERVEPEIMTVKPSDTHIMKRGSVTSAALPPHELKNHPNYAHLYNLPAYDNQILEDEFPPATTSTIQPKVQAIKDKKSRWSNQPAQKVQVLVLDEENWDDVDIAEAESPKKSKVISTEVKEIEETNWDDSEKPEDANKETISSSENHETKNNNKKSCSETSEQKDSWDEDDKLPVVDEKLKNTGNPKKIDADFLGQQIAVQIEKIRHRQAILVQQHINTQVLIGFPPTSSSPPIIIEKLDSTKLDDMYDVSMPPPIIISADAIISSDVSPIDSVILAQAIQITNKARGFESIALAPVIQSKAIVAAPIDEIIDLVDAPEIQFDSREGIVVSRPTYGILKKKTPCQEKQIKLQNKLVENWDDNDDDESKPPQKVDFNILSSVLKSNDLLEAVSDEEGWDDDQDETTKNEITETTRNFEKEAKKRNRSRKKDEKYQMSSDKDNWDDEEADPVYHQVDPDILARHMAEFAAGKKKIHRNISSVDTPKASENKSGYKPPKSKIVEDENWDDDPELEEASKKLVDPEILAKNVPLKNSMDTQVFPATSNKIEPLENTSESFRKEYGDSSKHREKNNVIKALSSLSTSVASMPVTAAIAAYAAQKRKLNESYDYQPRRECIDHRKHVDPYSYLPDYAMPVDYGRVPQSHPTHYSAAYDYNKYHKINYPIPPKELSYPETKKPKLKQQTSVLPVAKKKTVVEVEKKNLFAEDLSDGEIVDSEEDFGSEISSLNEDDDDVIEIPAKVDLVDLTEEEIAAAVKVESDTTDNKNKAELNPPLPSEEIDLPKPPPELQDSPESPMNNELNQDPEEWHEEQNEIINQENSPASSVINIVASEELKKNEIIEKINSVSSVNIKDSIDDQNCSKEIVETLSENSKSTIDKITASSINKENVAFSEEIEKCHFDDSQKAPEDFIASKDNEIEDSPASPINNEPETLEAAPDNSKTSSVSPLREEKTVTKETTEEIEVDKLPVSSHNEEVHFQKEMRDVDASPDNPVKECSVVLECPISSVNNDCLHIHTEQEINNSVETTTSILSTDSVEAHDEKQIEIKSTLVDTFLNTQESVKIDSSVDEIREKNETPKIDVQQIEDGNQVIPNIDEDAEESDSEINDEDILLDDDELEAAALYITSEETEKVPEVTATASVSNEIFERSFLINETEVRFNPLIIIKKEKLIDLPIMAKDPTPVDYDSDIEEVPVTETPPTNRRSNRIRQSSMK